MDVGQHHLLKYWRQQTQSMCCVQQDRCSLISILQVLLCWRALEMVVSRCTGVWTCKEHNVWPQTSSLLSVSSPNLKENFRKKLVKNIFFSPGMWGRLEKVELGVLVEFFSDLSANLSLNTRGMGTYWIILATSSALGCGQGMVFL